MARSTTSRVTPARIDVRDGLVSKLAQVDGVAIAERMGRAAGDHHRLLGDRRQGHSGRAVEGRRDEGEVEVAGADPFDQVGRAALKPTCSAPR
jgi:hypothetical protein